MTGRPGPATARPRHAALAGAALTARRSWIAAAAVLVLAGCASSAIDRNFAGARDLTRGPLGADVEWLTTDAARDRARRDVDTRLARAIDADDAVRIALAHSPALQAMLFDSAADSAATTGSARLPNPVFAFERLLRDDGGMRELELTRTLSFSVLDLLLLPSRLRLADQRRQVDRLALAGRIVEAATDARRAWIDAVAAQQALVYVRQVKATADASAELARRMQAVGNFSRLQRAREQAFAADAVARLARATQAALAAREALVRTLGLDDRQAAALKLPDRLPELPAAPKDEATIAQAALDQRLDLRLARANLAFVARENGLTRVTGLVDGLEVGITRKSETGLAPKRGYELSLPLPIFDFGDAGRARAEATYMGAFNRTAQLAVDASSQVRETYAAYRTAYDLARHYRDEIVPLRQAIADENLLRYNGMLIGVFDLLADAREQIGSVVLAIDAQRDFWRADAALQSTLLGRPGAAMPTAAGDGPARGDGPTPTAGH